MVFDPDDKDKDASGYKSPKASIDNNNEKWGPFSKRKVPLDDYHVCPCCNGKGFVNIVEEKDVSNVPRRIKRDIRGNLMSD